MRYSASTQRDGTFLEALFNEAVGARGFAHIYGRPAFTSARGRRLERVKRLCVELVSAVLAG